MLGYVSIKAKDYDRALAAYNRALAIEPGFAAALYNVGVIHALKQEKDEAFLWLEEVSPTRKLDMIAVQVDPDLVSLRGGPLLTLTAESARDGLGIGSAGDVDHDGHAEVSSR